MVENSNEVINKTKVSFISIISYKIDKKSNKKLILLTKGCFLTNTLWCSLILFLIYYYYPIFGHQI